MTEMPVRCTVLDDYQGAATASTDWSPITDRVAVRTLREHIADEAQLASVLQDDEIVVIMRERTPFPASLFDRLPRLRLLVTTGWRNASVDLAAAARHGVTVCGTGSGSRPPAELTWALILGLARHLVTENSALRGRRPLAEHDRHGSRRINTRATRAGQDRTVTSRASAWHSAWTCRPGARTSPRNRRRHKAFGALRRWHDLFASSDIVSIHLVLGDRSRGLVDHAALAAMRAVGVSDQHRAGGDRRSGRADRSTAGIGGSPAPALDVFDIEPLPSGHPFPHVAERARHATPRLCRPEQLRHILCRGRRGHRRLPERHADPASRRQ